MTHKFLKYLKIRNYLLSVEKSNNLSSCMLVSRLLMIQHSISGGQNQISELSGGENVVRPLFQIFQLNIESRRDNPAFIDSSEKLHNDLSGPVVVNYFKFSNVASLLHELQEFYQDFWGRSNQHLSLSFSFSVHYCFQSVSDNINLHRCLYLIN